MRKRERYTPAARHRRRQPPHPHHRRPPLLQPCLSKPSTPPRNSHYLHTKSQSCRKRSCWTIPVQRPRGANRRKEEAKLLMDALMLQEDSQGNAAFAEALLGQGGIFPVADVADQRETETQSQLPPANERHRLGAPSFAHCS
jgi:hypothetical protein